jgi:hypothetical protein
MIDMSRMFKCVFCVFVCVQLCGCALLLVGAASGGTALWLAGKLQREFSAPLDATLSATEQAVSSLRLTVVKTTVKEEVAQIIATYSDGRRVWIDLHKMSPSVTRVQIRVGAAGDETSARRIMNQIERAL